MPEIKKLTETAGDLQMTLADLTHELKHTSDQSAWARRLASLAAGGMVAALIAAALGIAYGADARATAQDIITSRTETRISACIQQNVTTGHERQALKQSLLALVPPGQPLTAAQQTVADRYAAEVDLALPFRDCSPEGITSYYVDPPADPAVAG